MLAEEKKPKTTKKKKPKKKGRKNYWDILNMPDKLESVRGWCMQGSTDAEIMKMLGISRETFYKWKRDKLEFADTLKRGKDIANGELLNSAFRQSTGYYIPITQVVKLKKPVMIGQEPILVDGEPIIVDGKPLMKGGKLVYEEVAELVPATEYVEPNGTMNIFMLKNRMPEQYKDKHEVEHTGSIRLEDLMGDGSK